MKKQIVTILLSITLTASILSGCKAKETVNSSAAINEAIIEESMTPEETRSPSENANTESEEAAVVESQEPIREIDLSLSIISASDDESFKACDEQGKEYILTLAESFPKEAKTLLIPGSNTTVTIIEGEESIVNGETHIVITNAFAIAEEEDVSLLEAVAFEKIHGFSVDQSITGKMYAKQAVNVRSGPSTEYVKIGGLEFAEEIMVTGAADSGWYQIQYNDQTGYVSNNYLVTEKPVAQTVKVETPTPATADSQSSEGASFYAVYSEAEMNDALAKGDLAAYFKMLNANSGATMGGGTVEDNSGSAASVTVAEKSTSLSTDFVDYLNQKRVESGLSELSWSDSMGSTAQERAEEIVSDFSHNGVRNCSAENIAQMNSANVSSWYDAFYNSSTHKQNMMDSTYKSAAAAVCQVGSSYYIVVLFGF